LYYLFSPWQNNAGSTPHDSWIESGLLTIRNVVMKKVLMPLLAAILFGCSMQVYANDLVTFDIKVQPSDYYSRTFSLISNDGALASVSSDHLVLQATNVYGKGEVIPYLNRRIQTGMISVERTAAGETPEVLCTARWEHDFWIDEGSGDKRHDRFYLTITSGNTDCFTTINDYNNKNSGLHNDGQGYLITSTPQSAEITRHRIL
jgi:hypothetical protein